MPKDYRKWNAEELRALEDQRLAGGAFERHVKGMTDAKGGRPGIDACKNCQPGALCSIGRVFEQGFDSASARAIAVIQRGGVAA